MPEAGHILLTQEVSKQTCGQHTDVTSPHQVIYALNNNVYQHLASCCLTQYQILLGKSNISIHKSSNPEQELSSLLYTFFSDALECSWTLCLYLTNSSPPHSKHMWFIVGRCFILSAIKRSEYAITTTTQTIENLLLY